MIKGLEGQRHPLVGEGKGNGRQRGKDNWGKVKPRGGRKGTTKKSILKNDGVAKRRGIPPRKKGGQGGFWGQERKRHYREKWTNW